MMHELPTTTKIAAWLTAFFSIGPFVTTADLWLEFLPAYPAIVTFRTVGVLGHVLWFCAGLLGVAALFALRRGAVVFAAACVIFATVHIAGSRMVWFQLAPGNVLVALAAILAVRGARSRKRGQD